MQLNGEVTINFDMPRLFPVFAKLDLEAYHQWCEAHDLEPQLSSEQVLIYEYFEEYTGKPETVRPEAGIYGRTWIDWTQLDILKREYKGSTSCDIPERFLSVTV